MVWLWVFVVGMSEVIVLSFFVFFVFFLFLVLFVLCCFFLFYFVCQTGAEVAAAQRACINPRSPRHGISICAEIHGIICENVCKRQYHLFSACLWRARRLQSVQVHLCGYSFILCSVCTKCRSVVRPTQRPFVADTKTNTSQFREVFLYP